MRIFFVKNNYHAKVSSLYFMNHFWREINGSKVSSGCEGVNLEAHDC